MKIKGILFFVLPVMSFLQGADLEVYLDQILEDSLLNQAQVGFYIGILDEDRTVLDIGSRNSLAPASGLKLFTSAAALDIIGPDTRFHTRIFYDGYIENGLLKGDIYIRGGGDPTLGSDMVDGSAPLDSLMDNWFKAIRGAGIQAVEGRIRADNTLFDEHSIPDYWPWIDMGNYYAAGTNALCINDNLFHLYFQPGPYTGAPAGVLRTEPKIEGLSFDNHMKTGRPGSGDNGYIYAAPGQYRLLLRGTIPADGKPFSIKGALPDPALFCARHMRTYVIEKGIPVEGVPDKIVEKADYRDMKLITETQSPPLSDIVTIINKRSFNLYTEQLLYHIALHSGKQASSREGIRLLMDFLEDNGIETAGIKLYDGSGLSRTNRITARAMVELLRFAARRPWFESFYNSLAVTGDPDDIGYFKRFGRNTVLEKNARVKSGLITGVRSLSGYLESRSGKMLAFSFIVNNYNGSSRQIDRLFENMLIRAAESN